MNRIVCKLSSDDDFFPSGDCVNLNINDNKVFTYTFWKGASRLGNFISNIGLDILYLSLFVFAIDRTISRNKSLDCWSRKITLYVPVLEVEKWNDNKEIVQKLLNYLSGDTWVIEFRKREFLEREKSCREQIQKSKETRATYDNICMFSGGLDSFIGAIDFLESNGNNALFVSHYGGGKGVKEYQDLLCEEIMKRYDIEAKNFYSFYAAAKNGIEDTTRTRSFMFFAHAIALATSMNKPTTLFIPENGLISLNVPLTSSRLGSSSTRTTHPYYLSLMQQLLRSMECEILIKNPYQFFTKGEMIVNCKNKEFFKHNLQNTMSCSHPDYGRRRKETEACHCGHCLPCVIRKAAVRRAEIPDVTKYRDDRFKLGQTAKVNLNSYLLGMHKFDEKFAFLNIQKSGPVLENIKEYTNLYIRGMLELKRYLEEISSNVQV